MSRNSTLKSAVLGTLSWLYTRRHEMIVVVLAACYVLLMAHISIIRLTSLNAHYYDLGIMDQTVYNTSKGRFLELTNPHLLKNTSRLAIHFDPLMAVLAPLYTLHASPLMLIYAQTVVLAMGGIAVFLIARQILRSSVLGIVFALLYFMYYPMENANMFDFHVVTFATAGLLWAYLLLVIRPLKRDSLNTILGFSLLGLCMLSKENVALTTAFFGAYMYLTSTRKKLSLGIVVFSILFFIIVFYGIIPSFREGGSFALKYFDTSKPLVMVSQLFSIASIRYLVIILSPMAFLPLFSLSHLAIALPDILINLISSNGNMREAYFHYTSVITPFVMIASIYGFSTVRRMLSKFVSKNITTFAIIPVIVFIVLVNYRFGWSQRTPYVVDNEALEVLYEWHEIVADDSIVVSSTGSIAPFFTERRYFIDFLFDPSFASVGQSREDIKSQVDKYESADYVIIRKKDIETSDPIATDYYLHLISNPHFALVSDKNGIEVYRKDR